MDAASKLFTRRQGAAPPPPPPPKQVAPVLAAPSIALGSIALPKLPTLPSGQLIGTAITYLFYLSAAVFFIFLL